MKREGRRVRRHLLLRLLLALAALWGALAIYYLLRAGTPIRIGVGLVWGLMAAAGWYGLRPGRENWALPGLFGAAFALLFGIWWTLQPRQDRDWADEVARTLDARVQGSRVTLHNVRNFDWHADGSAVPRWDTRSYDLDRLVGADLSYWMGPLIAHTLVSFEFDDGQRVVFSLEIRKEREESFSALGGFFRQFEATLVAADERDILRVRTNVRGEDLYLYRLAIPPAQLRTLFLGYVRQAQALAAQPRWYNTLDNNCTTVVFDIARRIDPGLPLDYRLLLSGRFADYAYDHGGLQPGYDMATLRRLGQVTARARAAGDAPDFSTRIRQGVPGE
ncbi:DUF4105 domain-containing protein [Stenotrophomonas sp. HITSZ_GD]|uniref:Lnb N-terminal periplasmic domain-containing protein n=1 Tax=Stenotrophomonas sp. HITSZ_GD TaxID=3037248 RepID=UPI00240D4D0C|nr:DUF4105 domain-containing protein [Stenotrophomonas sp. HITSZ_GD]MDG2526303.1 DUF4105 domain-containing protein [Stenotrophomonas sp. HITSZ_GD]